MRVLLKQILLSGAGPVPVGQSHCHLKTPPMSEEVATEPGEHVSREAVNRTETVTPSRRRRVAPQLLVHDLGNERAVHFQ